MVTALRALFRIQPSLPILLLFVSLGNDVGLAQTLEGTIRGRVRDASGGVIPNATIAFRDTEKGIPYETRADTMGLYQAELPRGTYEVEVAAPGFSSVKQTGIQVSLGRTLAMDLTLPVSGAQESIEVRAELPLVDTASGTLSGLVDRERLSELPLNGRDFGSLALLQPGVVLNNNGANSPFGGKWANFIINGQLDQATLFLLDGSEINDTFSGRTPSGSSGLLLGLDGVAEFQVLLNNYKAEFGKNSGGVIRVATRSGSNRFHGSAFEYLRNSALDAKNFFDLPGSIPPFRRNQFGASLGGPIRRDQSFFFLNYEALRERKAIPAVATVPTAAVRSAAVPAVVPFLNLYPPPNGPVNPDGRTASLISSVTQPAREDFGLARVDHRWSDRTALLARASVQDSFVTPPFPSTPVPGFPQDLPHRNLFSLLGLTSAIGIGAVNEFHFAFNRTFQDVGLPPPPNGLTISPIPGRDFGLLVVSGISNLGTQTFVRRAALNLFEVADNFALRRGRHSQKYGISVQRYQANERRGTFFNGQYSFAGLDQFLTLAAVPPAPTPLFIGVLGGANASGVASPAGWRWTTFSGFAQDDIEVSPAFTVNLGVRYEFSSTPSEVNGLVANLRSPLDAQITVGGQLFNTIARSWSPRVGFAWSPLSGRDAALRGGYGVFFNPLVVNMYANSRLVPPFVETVSILRAPFPN
ncbi:MAG: TonB-dependent receptor domain-containing protein, partial [Terriglobia bacterium]